jgi:hypothetical protein
MAKNYTNKQMGDACEMLIAAELTLAGVPALKVPDLWPAYDVIAQPRDDRPTQRVSVKSRTFKRGPAYVDYDLSDEFDWLAIVLLPNVAQNARRIFIIPRDVADANARHDKPTAKTATDTYWRIDEVAKLFANFEGNFSLQHSPSPTASQPSPSIK